MNYPKLILLVIISIILVKEQTSAQCPAQCKCRPGIVNCRKKSLTILPTGPFKSEVKKLDLSNNAIRKVENNFFVHNNLTSLETLVLTVNKLRTITIDTLRGLSELNSLDLSYNEIDNIDPKAFDTLTRLTDLKLNNNSLLELPDTGFNLLSLKSLSLDRCGITTIPPNFFANMSSLNFLYLNENKISFLYETFFTELPKLERLNISANNFYYLQKEILELHSSITVMLVGNPWECDCRFRDDLKLYEDKQESDLICKSPEEMYDEVASRLLITDRLQCDTTTVSDTEPTTLETGTEETTDTDYVEVITAYPNPEDKANIMISPEAHSTTNWDEIKMGSVFDWLRDNQWWLNCVGVLTLALCFTVAIKNYMRKKSQQNDDNNIYFEFDESMKSWIYFDNKL